MVVLVQGISELCLPANLYLEGQGDLVSRLIVWTNRVTVWIRGIINLFTKFP